MIAVPAWGSDIFVSVVSLLSIGLWQSVFMCVCLLFAYVCAWHAPCEVHCLRLREEDSSDASVKETGHICICREQAAMFVCSAGIPQEHWSRIPASWTVPDEDMQSRKPPKTAISSPSLPLSNRWPWDQCCSIFMLWSGNIHTNNKCFLIKETCHLPLWSVKSTGAINNKKYRHQRRSATLKQQVTNDRKKLNTWLWPVQDQEVFSSWDREGQNVLTNNILGIF